jgi:hypothetical protein
MVTALTTTSSKMKVVTLHNYVGGAEGGSSEEHARNTGLGTTVGRGEQRLRRCSQGWYKCLWDESTDGPHMAGNFCCVERDSHCSWHPCVMQPFERIEGVMQPFEGIKTTTGNLPQNPTNADSNANLGSLQPYQLMCSHKCMARVSWRPYRAWPNLRNMGYTH